MNELGLRRHSTPPSSGSISTNSKPTSQPWQPTSGDQPGLAAPHQGHESPAIAHKAIAAGAIGVTCASWARPR